MIETREAVTLQVPARAHYIRVARLVGAGLANDLGADLDDLDDIRLAIGEACALAVQFGADTIDLHYTATERRLTVTGEASAPVDATAAGPADHAGHIGLVRQILAVACSEHTLSWDSGDLAFSLTFETGKLAPGHHGS